MPRFVNLQGWIQPEVEGGQPAGAPKGQLKENKPKVLEKLWVTNWENSLVFLLKNVLICMHASHSDRKS